MGLIHPTESSGIVTRLKEEFRLFKAQIPHILFYLFMCYYVGSCVFMNFAFYRYPTDVNKGMRLKDLGFEIIPEVNLENKEKIELFNMLVQIFSCTAIILASLFGNTPGRTKPHLVNMTRRILEMITLGSVLRFITFIFTTLPGAGDHCLEDIDSIQPPKPTTITEIFTRIDLT